MIITILFILALSWSISRGMKESALASILSERVKNVKPEVEMVIPEKEVSEKDGKTVHLYDYLQQQEFEEEDKTTQELVLSSLPDTKPAILFLN